MRLLIIEWAGLVQETYEINADLKEKIKESDEGEAKSKKGEKAGKKRNRKGVKEIDFWKKRRHWYVSDESNPVDLSDSEGK